MAYQHIAVDRRLYTAHLNVRKHELSLHDIDAPMKAGALKRRALQFIKVISNHRQLAVRIAKVVGKTGGLRASPSSSQHTPRRAHAKKKIGKWGGWALFDFEPRWCTAFAGN